MPRTLIVDDRSIVALLEEYFRPFNHQVIDASTVDEAVGKARTEAPDIIIIDMVRLCRGGIQRLGELRKLNPDGCILVLTASGDEGMMVEALEYGASACLSKPFSLGDLTDLLRQQDIVMKRKKVNDGRSNSVHLPELIKVLPCH